MNPLKEIRACFQPVLAQVVEDPTPLLNMIVPAKDPKNGDYQANVAMPLKKVLGKRTQDIAANIVRKLDISDLCEPPEVAGPGFINLRLRNDWLTAQLKACLADERLLVEKVSQPKTYVIDFSSPNVAKPMHVGHIRSTVIGDSLSRTLRFVGHKVITDNHLGDWGTQFGMIIYGYKHFVDADAYATEPVEELGRLYKLVRQIMDYHDAVAKLPQIQATLAEAESDLEEAKTASDQIDASDKKAVKTHKKLVGRLTDQVASHRSTIASLEKQIASVDADAGLKALVDAHPKINDAVLQETAKLHTGDAENLQLWQQFMPQCLAALQVIYDRLGVTFDRSLGESFYHDRLPDVIKRLEEKGLATPSDGAICVFMEEWDAPMLVQKQDGAYLYATTDLATVFYRLDEWQPDEVLYVVDFRQGEHFAKFFRTIEKMGYQDLKLQHVKFGTVMGEDKKPYRTRSGDAVGLTGLLDQAVNKAHEIVCNNDDTKKIGPELDAAERKQVAQVVGISAIKYADLSHNRESDYVFSYDKMTDTKGNTATYMQYAYARVQSIFRRGNFDPITLRDNPPKIILDHPSERGLAIALVRFSEAIDAALGDYRPNQLTDYLFELAQRYSNFFNDCAVIKAESDELKQSRFALCDLTARTIKCGLELLGIDVVERM
jgi:arginyl-tRNA synthetase